jgi:hypothetical protein
MGYDQKPKGYKFYNPNEKRQWLVKMLNLMKK